MGDVIVARKHSRYGPKFRGVPGNPEGLLGLERAHRGETTNALLS